MVYNFTKQDGTVVSVDYMNFKELIKKEREKFIEERTKAEQMFTNWRNALLTCSKDNVLSKIKYDVNSLSLQILVPELYKDRPNKEIVEQQRCEANAIIKEIDDVLNEFNKIAAQHHFEYMELKGRLNL